MKHETLKKGQTMELRTKRALVYLFENSNFHSRRDTKTQLITYDLTSMRFGNNIKFDFKSKTFSKCDGKLLKEPVEESVVLNLEDLQVTVDVEFNKKSYGCHVKFKNMDKIFKEEVAKLISKVKFRYRDLFQDFGSNEQSVYMSLISAFRTYNKE